MSEGDKNVENVGNKVFWLMRLQNEKGIVGRKKWD